MSRRLTRLIAAPALAVTLLVGSAGTSHAAVLPAPSTVVVVSPDTARGTTR